jgi:hypothetical protein
MSPDNAAVQDRKCEEYGNENSLPRRVKRMRSKLALSFFALSGLALLPAAGLANNARQDRDDDRGKVREMTGCLQRDGNEYELMADNGGTWELKGDRDRLADHVGQTIRVTGTVDHDKMHDAKERAKEKTQDNPNEHGHLTVTNVKMVSRSCGR